jgi:hypothetical protein
MVVGTVLGGLLPYTSAGIREAGVARDVRSLQNAVDGAMQGAISQARLDADACVGTNRPTYTAPGYPDALDPSNASKAINVTVTCQPAPGSGGSDSSVPPYAIITTNGPFLMKGNAKALGVTGGIYANGDIGRLPGAGNQLLVDVTGAAHVRLRAGNGECVSPCRYTTLPRRG